MDRENENTAREEQRSKILTFLRSRDTKNISLGIQLLKSTNDEKLILSFLNDPSYMSAYISFQMVTYFQQNKEMWKRIAPKVKSHISSTINEHLRHYIIELEECSIPDFCQIATTKAREVEANFPALTPSILVQKSGGYCHSSLRGEKIEDGIGWVFTVDARDIGPAEVIHEEDWVAIAHLKDRKLKFVNQDRRLWFPWIWMEILPLEKQSKNKK